MNQDFSKLSYKELQALAVKNRIPGNIKKNILVDILGALKCGDEGQVRRILIELKENRKRKVRKRKLEKMTAVTSTPLHSPNYSSFDDRFYSPQHLSPYHWAPPDEEIMRDDSHYEIFRQYLIHRIQTGYQNLDANNNNNNNNVAALNLKASTIESGSRSSFLATSSAQNPVMPSSLPEGYHAGGQNESQTANNCNENNYRPMILQKMLQAPLGTNLSAMARLEANRLWSSEHYRSNRELWENNSDTVTAGSESNDENWDDRADFYNQNQLPQFTLEQMMHFFQTSNQNGLNQHNSQFTYAPPNVQENCQSWIENNSVDYRGPMDYVETTDSARVYASYSGVEQTSFQNQTDGSFPVLEQPQGVANHSEITGLQAQNVNSYYHQWPAQPSQPYRADYYEQTNLSNIFTSNVPFNTNVTQQFSGLQTQDSIQYGMYSQECATSSHSSVDQIQYSMYHPHPNYNQPVHTLSSNLAQSSYGNLAGDQNNNLRPTVNGIQKEGNNFLDPYWPKWTNNNSGQFRLENMLNLQTVSTTDCSKLDNTCTVYCFVTPLVSQISGISGSQKVERSGLVTAKRQYTITTNSLVYSDSTTGMKMANLPSEIARSSERTGSDESIITLEYISDDSHHHEPIQEIWIPDYSNRDEHDSNDFLSSSCETIPE